MENLKNKSCCVYDFGTFMGLAMKLSESFGKVYYHSPWQSSFPKSNFMMIGEGVPGVERVNNFWDIVPECDLFVFPDVHCGDVAEHLSSLGKQVWGSRHGEELELFRDKSKEYCKSLGINIGNYEVIIGITALRAYLKSHKNQWIKFNITRGDMETFHAENYKIVEPRLDYLEWSLGAKKNITKFIVEDAIEDAIETGYDGYCIDGQYPSKGIYGIEIKDKGYIAIAKDYKDIPEEITDVNKKLSDTLKKYSYRNFFSTELRVTQDRKGYLIDPCMRAGSPPSEIYTNMFENLAEIIWEGSKGNCVDPVIKNKYGVELLIHSNWAMENWQAITFPEEYKDCYKFRNLCRIDNKYYSVPSIIPVPEIGAIVATDDTLEGAIDKLKFLSEQIESYDIKTFPDVIETAMDGINKLKAWGLDF